MLCIGFIYLLKYHEIDSDILEIMVKGTLVFTLEPKCCLPVELFFLRWCKR